MLFKIDLSSSSHTIRGGTAFTRVPHCITRNHLIVIPTNRSVRSDIHLVRLLVPVTLPAELLRQITPMRLILEIVIFAGGLRCYLARVTLTAAGILFRLPSPIASAPSVVLNAMCLTLLFGTDLLSSRNRINLLCGH